MQRLLAASLACAVSPFYAMENSQQLQQFQQSTTAIRIQDILTPVYDKHTNAYYELGALLRDPSAAFKKTDIVIIDTDTVKKEIKVTQQGELDSLTRDNISSIATGFVCYHPCTKKSYINKDAYGMDVGTLAIDVDIISSKKDDSHLKAERHAIFVEALQRKMEEDKQREKEYEEAKKIILDAMNELREKEYEEAKKILLDAMNEVSDKS